MGTPTTLLEKVHLELLKNPRIETTLIHGDTLIIKTTHLLDLHDARTILRQYNDELKRLPFEIDFKLKITERDLVP